MRKTPAATLIVRAVDFAAARHRDQRRKGDEAAPYINHPVAVARLLAEPGGVTDAEVLAAAFLHDTVEDTATTVREIEELFGSRVAGIVAELTDDKSLPADERRSLQEEKAARYSSEAKAVRIADKIANVRDVSASPPPSWSPAARRGYLRWARRVVERCRGANPPLERLFDRTLADAEDAAGGEEGAGPP